MLHVFDCRSKSEVSRKTLGTDGLDLKGFLRVVHQMITKTAGSPDVHELVLSKEEFLRKEQNKEDVYKGTILNRKPGDSSHVTNDERFLRSLITEETGNKSFTAVVITGVCLEDIDYLKQHFLEWTRELAHIYHYYIHGIDGNKLNGERSVDRPNIDILVTLREKPPKCPRAINLREVDDDMQTLYINSAVSMFEFRATTSNGGTVEGILRYHPFLYDKETYPKDPYTAQEPVAEDDHENEPEGPNQARGKRDIFECFWNGRLVPYTTVSEFDWCTRPIKGASLPAECYSRFSGVLFTDDRFQVNASKLKFMDLELKLKNKDTIFTTFVNNQKTSKRSNIEKEFTQWLETCHENFDKQVKFIEYLGTITRTDMAMKRRQHPWATFSSIEFGGNVYKTGQLVKSQKTQPLLYGSVVRFLLYGDHNQDVYATGGQVEIRREPEALYDRATKIIAISKIDTNISVEGIKTVIENDLDKLPEELKLEWPEGNDWPQNAIRPAGTVFGPLKVEILNRKGDLISKILSGGQGIKLDIELQIVHHGPKENKEFPRLAAPFLLTKGHWFKKIETLRYLGKYTLTLQTVIHDSCATVYGGKPLPSHVLKFTIKEGSAESFTVGPLSSPLRVGVPFDIPLEVKDGYNHPTKLPPKIKPVLECSGLELSYRVTSYSGTTFIIKDVKARGKVQNYQQNKGYVLNVTIPGLKADTQTFTISLLPGNPHLLHVKPDSKPIKLENGNPTTFLVEVHDEAGNITADLNQIVQCKVTGLPLMVVDCSNTGVGQLVTTPINLNIINGEPKILEAEFSMPSQKHVKPVVTELKVMPSSRVTKMVVFCQGEDSLVLNNKEKIKWEAGGLLENLFYKLYDESGTEVSITEKVASRIKVNWTDDYQSDVVQGKLPDVRVPKQVKEERFCQVSYQELSVSFCIVPCPDEPARMKVTSPQSTLRLGETLAGHIKLEFVDQYDNITKKFTPTCTENITVEAEGLDKSNINFTWQESSSSVLVTGLQFRSGSLGPREIIFSYDGFTERVIVKLTEGVPSQLQLVSGPEQPLQLINGHGIPTPFVVQLCDKWGNPSPDQRVVVEIRSSPPMIKVSASVMSQPVDAEGKASFIVNSVTGQRGYYQLDFKGSFNRKPIPGPSVSFTVIPDPNKPVRLQVDYVHSAKFLAGHTFPVFAVTVVSDEGSPIMTFNPAKLSMLLWEGASSKPTQPTTELKCNKPMANEKKDSFYFRDKLIPEHVGKYTIQFSLCVDKKEVLLSSQITINVVASLPVKLGPLVQPTTPVVSNSSDISSRILVKDMTLVIKDSFGNPAGQELSGKVVVSIGCPDGESSRCLPLFEDKTSSFQINLEEGRAHISRLVIMENSPGENGSRYNLIFKPTGLNLPTSLLPFELLFHFYNDAENQRRMSELSRKRDELKNSIEKYDAMCSTFCELRKGLTIQLQDIAEKETTLRVEMSKRNLDISHPLPSSDIDKLIRDKTIEAETIERVPRRKFSVTNKFGGPDVLGMVGHLALILDDDAARVISWHLVGDMDCIITRTTEAAQRIYRDTRGVQQVMALDSILVPPGKRPLPHIRNGCALFSPVGNPVYAKDLLIYSGDLQSCDLVFKNFLGFTILMDDLTSATNYRKALVENRINCPTILTREGDRVSARGKFGGAQNKAPPIVKLRVFGAPLPQHYHTLKEQLDLLEKYKSIRLKMEQVEKAHDECIMEEISPKRLQERQKVEEMKKEFEEIERQLSSVRLGKRGPENPGEPSGIQTKRPRQKSRDLLPDF
ncbi:structural maintenance of chromosomes flexible hinge domain-containing protein 1 isoform X2 [Nothobranchius furzeri]|uniref:structural maintenance of chromosomes flexible hinge domain-containing protein 1 isoform X2 n=1 Tax=Nothobranchius furzeri TaxID=105023 RepID=UPI003904BA5A